MSAARAGTPTNVGAVYVVDLRDVDVATCAARNVHGWSEAAIQAMAQTYALHPTPANLPRMRIEDIEALHRVLKEGGGVANEAPAAAAAAGGAGGHGGGDEVVKVEVGSRDGDGSDVGGPDGVQGGGVGEAASEPHAAAFGGVLGARRAADALQPGHTPASLCSGAGPSKTVTLPLTATASVWAEEEEEEEEEEEAAAAAAAAAARL